MATPIAEAKSATLTLNIQNQNIDSINRVVAQILKRGGCDGCGRLARLKFDFHVNPAPEFAKEGVLSVQMHGL